MKILITGIGGFAGSTLALALREAHDGLEIGGVDNFVRPGSERNRQRLQAAGIKVTHADLRLASDLETLPEADWILDAAANASVLSGVGGGGATSRQLMQHNLEGTINLLEHCRARGSGLILLSTSRVYSIAPLAALRVEARADSFCPVADQDWPPGLGPEGVTERFSTQPPVSLYGATKVCAETLALEYSQAFGFPVWINRLGVLAGAGQFGRADQGIFSYWIHACAAKRPLKYIGFGGAGHQVRDCLHPRDLAAPLWRQMRGAPAAGEAVTNFAGGLAQSLSLRRLHAWCEDCFGPHPVQSEPANRPFDVPWMVLDCALAARRFDWRPVTPLPAILEEIARHAKDHPDWLETTGG